MSRLPHFLDSWLTEGEPYMPATLYPREDSWYSFLLEAEAIAEAVVRLGGLGHLKNPLTLSGIEPVTFWLVV
jgi:hypothetical protein